MLWRYDHISDKDRLRSYCSPQTVMSLLFTHTVDRWCLNNSASLYVELFNQYGVLYLFIEKIEIVPLSWIHISNVTTVSVCRHFCFSMRRRIKMCSENSLRVVGAVRTQAECHRIFHKPMPVKYHCLPLHSIFIKTQP